MDTHGPETCHSAFAKCRCTAIVERIIMKLVCKMISTVDYHVFGYEITMYYYAIHWELSQCTWLAVDAGRERGRHPRLEQAVLGLWSPHGVFLRRRGRTVLSTVHVPGGGLGGVAVHAIVYGVRRVAPRGVPLVQAGSWLQALRLGSPRWRLASRWL